MISCTQPGLLKHVYISQYGVIILHGSVIAPQRTGPINFFFKFLIFNTSSKFIVYFPLHEFSRYICVKKSVFYAAIKNILLMNQRIGLLFLTSGQCEIERFFLTMLGL